MCERYPSSYLYGGHPVSSWDRAHLSHSLERNFNSLENQIQHQHRARLGSTPRYWGSMSEGGGLSSMGGGDQCKTNLIVNYLPQTMTEKDLYAMFMTIGPIESCRVMKDFKTGYSYGFGFVNYTREEDAAKAIDTFNGYQLRNKRLKVSYARPSGDDIKDTNLYVTNLPRVITEEQLETIFGKYGRIVQKHILRDKSNGTPRGVAFVRFDKREEAQEAIAALNNVIPEGGTEPLSVKPACVGLLRGGVAQARRASYSAHGHANTYTQREYSMPHRDMHRDTPFRDSYSMPHRDAHRDTPFRDTYSLPHRDTPHRDAHSLPRDAYSLTHRDAYLPLRTSNSLPNRDSYSLHSSSLPNRDSYLPLRNSNSLPHRSSQRDVYSQSLPHRDTTSLFHHRDMSVLTNKERSQTPGPVVAEEHGKQKAAYYAGWAAGFHHNRDDFEWGCGSCIMPDPWDKFQPPPLGGSYPNTPRNGCRPACPNTRIYPNYIPGKGRASRGRNLPWAPGFGEGYKGQRCRNGPSPYW